MRIRRLALVAGWLGTVLFVVTTFVDGATRPGYDPWIDYVSHLSLGDGGAIERANLVACGACVIAFAIAFGRMERRSRAASRGAALLATFGGALAFTGVLVGDPRRGYPPGAPIEVHHTVLGTLHDVAGLVAFVAIAAAMAALARYFTVDRHDRAWARYSTVTAGVFVTAAFAAAALTVAHGGSAVDQPVGVLQRVAIVVGWGWLALLARRFEMEPALGILSVAVSALGPLRKYDIRDAPDEAATVEAAAVSEPTPAD